MATLTPTLGSGVSNTGYTVLEHQQAIANSYASYRWAAGTSWTTSGDALTIVSPAAYDHFVDPVSGDLRDSVKAELRRIPRPSAKRYMTAAITAPDTVVLTLSDTRTGGAATGDGFDGNGYTYGPPGASF